MIDALAAAGKFPPNMVHPLSVKLTGAIKNIQNGDVDGASGKLQSAINQVGALVKSRRLAASDAAPVQDLLTRVVSSLTP
jgi:hypothetical protein